MYFYTYNTNESVPDDAYNLFNIINYITFGFDVKILCLPEVNGGEKCTSIHTTLVSAVLRDVSIVN